MYDDWQPMTKGNRSGNGNGNGNGNSIGNDIGNGNGNGNSTGNNSGERKNYTRGRNQGGHQNNYSNNRSNNSYPQQQQQYHQQQNQTSQPAQIQGNTPVAQSSNVDIVLKEEAYNVVGCAINILNELGPGLAIECYEKALKVEFGLKDIPLLDEKTFPIIYKEVNVGEFTVKLIAYETIIVLPIVTDSITEVDIAKMINQLKVTHYQAGLIFNFKYPKLQWQRVIL